MCGDRAQDKERPVLIYIELPVYAMPMCLATTVIAASLAFDAIGHTRISWPSTALP